jgi:RNA polymerase sigma factor (sigma-70 family)
MHLAELLRAVATGSSSAMAELYELTRLKVFSICLDVCQDRAAAEDVLQDVYERVWQRAGSWQSGPASPISWLVTIARNRSIDWRRKQVGREVDLRYADGAHDDGPNPEVHAQLLHDVQWCMSRLNELDDPFRHTLSDVYIGEMTYLQVALRDDIPLSTVKSRSQRGLRKLQARAVMLQLA